MRARSAPNLPLVVILLSALAVVAAAILLVVWFVVGGGFTLIYAAMALAVVSMLLLWAARWIGSTPAPAGSLAPAPLAEEIRVEVPIRDEADEEADVRRPFPIADYEHLWVTQILPLLPELDDEELAVVEARERGARHRGGILDAIGDLRRKRTDGRGERALVVDEAASGAADERSADDGDRLVGERSAPIAALAADDPLSDVDGSEVDPPLLDHEGDDDDADAFERAWNQLTAIDDLDDLAVLDRSSRDLSRFGADLDLTDDAGADAGADRVEAADVAPDGAEPASEIDDGTDESEPEVVTETETGPELVGATPRGPRVRTFLGRVSSPITVDHGVEDGLP